MTTDPTPTSPSTAASDELSERCAWLGDLRASLGEVIVGQTSLVDSLLVALMTGGHVLLEGVPGLAKSLAVSSLANAVGGSFTRLQFTPDLLPSDLVGTEIYNAKDGTFSVRKGPVFVNFCLADEINRAPAKVQSALLEAMQERQVSIGGETHALPSPFLVLATQNPLEQEGTYPLPEAQLDRFMFRVRVGYPERTGEINLLDLQEKPAAPLEQVCKPEQILRIQAFVDKVHCSTELKAYIVDLIRETRQHREVLLGASPRAGIFMLKAARARALVRGKTFCTHEDVQAIVNPVLEHRVIMRPEAELAGRDIRSVLEDVVKKIPVLEG